MTDRPDPVPAVYPPTFAEGEPLDACRRAIAEPSAARLFHWGVRDYGSVLALQERLREARRAGRIPDTWLAGEHPTVITHGVRGGTEDVIGSPSYPVFTTDRGGRTTIHTPGQLVIYPIVRTHAGLTAQARAARALLEAARRLIRACTGVELVIHRGRPGLYAPDGRKVAAIGLSIRGCVLMHGVAINCCNDLAPWRYIIACGEPDTAPATLSQLAGRTVTTAELAATLPAWLRSVWGYARVDRIDEAQLDGSDD